MTPINEKSKIDAFESLFIAYLGKENHAVFVRRVAGETLKKIACDMGVSVQTIHGRVQRIKLKLSEAGIKLTPAVERLL